MTAYSDNPGSSTAKLRSIFASAIKRHDSKLSDPKQRELATDIVDSILVALETYGLDMLDAAIDQISGRIEAKIRQLKSEGVKISDDSVNDTIERLSNAVANDNGSKPVKSESSDDIGSLLTKLLDQFKSFNIKSLQSFFNTSSDESNKQQQTSATEIKTDNENDVISDKDKFANFLSDVFTDMVFFDDYLEKIHTIMTDSLKPLETINTELTASNLALAAANLELAASTISLASSNFALASSNIALAGSNIVLSASNFVLAASKIILAASNIVLALTVITSMGTLMLTIITATVAIITSVIGLIVTVFTAALSVVAAIVGLMLSVLSVAISIIFGVSLIAISVLTSAAMLAISMLVSAGMIAIPLALIALSVSLLAIAGLALAAAVIIGMGMIAIAILTSVGIMVGVGVFAVGVMLAATIATGALMISAAIGTFAVATALGLGLITLAILSIPLIFLGLIIGLALIAWFFFIKPVVDKIISIYNTYIKPIIDKISDFISKIWNEQIKPAIDKIMGFLEPLWNEWIKPAIDGIMSFIGQLWNKWIKPAIDGIMSFIKPIWENVIEPLIKGIKWAWNNLIKPVVDYFYEKYELVAGAVNKVKGVITGVNPDNLAQTNLDGYQQSINNIMTEISGSTDIERLNSIIESAKKQIGNEDLASLSGQYRKLASAAIKRINFLKTNPVDKIKPVDTSQIDTKNSDISVQEVKDSLTENTMKPLTSIEDSHMKDSEEMSSAANQVASDIKVQNDNTAKSNAATNAKLDALNQKLDDVNSSIGKHDQELLDNTTNAAASGGMLGGIAGSARNNTNLALQEST